MKQYEDSAGEIVKRIVESDDDMDFDKDILDMGQDDTWHQISGDANPWVWGGTWYNEQRKEIIHFEGIDQSENREVDYRDIEVPEAVVAKVKAKVHDPYLDTDEAKEDPAWLKRMLFSEEMEMDRLFDQYKIAKADFINKRKQHTFQRVHVDEQLPYHWRRYENKCPTGLADETWEQMSMANKVDELCQYFGWREYSSSFELNQKEAEALLGPHNI
jgi:hypothetical protein